MITIGGEDSPDKEPEHKQQNNDTEDGISMKCSINGKPETQNNESNQVSSFVRNHSKE